MGLGGEAEGAAMDPNLRDRILASPRAKELAGWQPPEPSIGEVRKNFGGPGVSDDELLLRYLAGNDAVVALRAASPRSEHGIDARLPLAILINELAKKTGLSQIKIEKKGFLFHLARAGQDGAY